MEAEIIELYNIYCNGYGLQWVETTDFRRWCCSRMKIGENEFNGICFELMDKGQLRQRIFAGKFYININQTKMP